MNVIVEISDRLGMDYYFVGTGIVPYLTQFCKVMG